jgi:hypothetical protein
MKSPEQYTMIRLAVPYQDFTFPISAVVSMGRRNTQLEPTLH